MTTILLNEATRAALAAVRAADKAAAEAADALDATYKRDGAAMSAARDAWRTCNPGRHIAHVERDPGYVAASAEYRRAQEVLEAASHHRTLAGRALARAVDAQVRERAAQIGAYRLPTLTVQKRPVGFRYLVDGAKARDSKRGQPYAALLVSLCAVVSEGGITQVGWSHSDEYSATSKRLIAKALKCAPSCHGSWRGTTLIAPLTVCCGQTVITAQEAQS